MLQFLHKFLGIIDQEEEEPSASTAQPTAAQAAGPSPRSTVQTDDGISIPRLEIIQAMWGEGFSAPTNTEILINMAKPLMLDPQKSVLDLSAGLGGGARLLAKQFKTYVNGFERDEELAKAGMGLSNLTGHGRNATIAHYDPLQFEYPKKADVIIGRELLYTIENKDGFIQKIVAHLKPRGQLLLTDFTCDPDFLNRPPVSLMIAAEPYGAYMVSAKTMAAMLEKHGFDVRVNEDISQPYSRTVLLGLSRMAKFLDGKKLNRETKTLIGSLVDLWAKRLAAIDLAVQNTRFYAIKMR